MPPLAGVIQQDEHKKYLVRQIQDAWTLAVHHSRQGLIPFLHHWVIDARPEPKLFRLVAEPWQWAWNRRHAKALERVAGFPEARDYSGPRKFWYTMPRGHDKTTGIGRTVAWLLGFSRRPLLASVAAGDREQAAFLRDYMKIEAKLNPWCEARLDFQRNVVKGVLTESKLDILSSDAAGSFGGKSDVVIVDELTWWENRELFDALHSGSEKRPGSVFIVISNAGIQGSWQDELLQVFKKDPSWSVYEAPGQIAGWMDAEATARMAATLPPALAKRVIHNQWQDPSEAGGYLERAEIEACLGRWSVQEEYQPKPGVGYFAALDYGPKKDRTVGAVVRREGDGVALVKMRVWQGSRDSPVSIEFVEQWLLDVQAVFGRHLPVKFIIDEYQLEATYQKLAQPNGPLVMEKYQYRGGKGNYEMAANLRNLVVNKQLAWPWGVGEVCLEPSPSRRLKPEGGQHTLADEMAELIVKTTPYGYRFDHESGRHDDRCVALGMACLACVKEPVKPAFQVLEGYC